MKSIEQRFANVANSKTFRNIINTYSLGSKSVLDIGCSYGEFLAHFGPNSLGLTVSPEEVMYGKHKGLDIQFGNIEEDVTIPHYYFDVIFANNLFEHLQSPHVFLTKIKRYVKPDGLLILGVPCIPAITWLTRFKKFRGSFASLHINFFTRLSLNKTVEASGWNISETRGFRFFSPIIDRLLDPIYPHFYVIAHINHSFEYSGKRKEELKGYTTTHKEES